MKTDKVQENLESGLVHRMAAIQKVCAELAARSNSPEVKALLVALLNEANPEVARL